MIDHVSIQCRGPRRQRRLLRRRARPARRQTDHGFRRGRSATAPSCPSFWLGPGDDRRRGRREVAPRVHRRRPGRGRGPSSRRRSRPAPRCCTSRGCGPSTTPTTSGHSSATPTATTSRPSATDPSNRPPHGLAGDRGPLQRSWPTRRLLISNHACWAMIGVTRAVGRPHALVAVARTRPPPASVKGSVSTPPAAGRAFVVFGPGSGAGIGRIACEPVCSTNVRSRSQRGAKGRSDHPHDRATAGQSTEDG